MREREKEREQWIDGEGRKDIGSGHCVSYM